MTTKTGLKLLGLILMAAMISASTGCRKKTQPNIGPVTLTPSEPGGGGGIDDPGVGEEVTTPDLRNADVNGIKVEGLNLDPVMFKFDSAQLDNAELAKCDKVAALLNDNPTYKLVIEGNCDERGTTEYNMALGERRAQAVRAYLLNAGGPDARIQTLSYGEEKPQATGHSESDWSQNRRADFAIYE